MGDIVRAGVAAFLAVQPARVAVHRWLRAVGRCRTSALGGQVWRCANGHVQRVQYHSCKHRACPQCQGLAKEQWLTKLSASELLACDYYHVVFTVPHELTVLWQWNRAALGGLLLRAVRETVLTLTAERKWLGAQVGLLLSLHTWSRSLALHPHVHALITGGGWREGRWQPAKKGYLVPLAVVHALFRGKLLGLIQQGLTSGELVLPGGQRLAAWRTTCNRLGRKPWNVHLAGCYPHGRGVLTYLARYVKGGPLQERQLVSHQQGQVTFRYTDHQEGRRREMRLSTVAFLGRLAEHVPERGMRLVRHAGLFAPSNRGRLAACRQQLGQLPSEAPETLTAAAYLERVGVPQPTTCTVCGLPLQCYRLARYQEPPPLVSAGHREVA